MTAEPVIEYSMTGVVQSREGNRRRGYLQGVYPTSDDDVWVALSLPDGGGPTTMCSTSWSRLDPHADRRGIVETLREQGIPAEHVITGDQMYDGDLIGAQLDARGYYQQLVHPVTGAHRYPGWPFRITPDRRPSPRCPADAGPAQRRNPGRPGPVRGRAGVPAGRTGHR